MATWTTFFQKTDWASDSGAVSRPGRHAHPLRDLPNEDMLFFTKRIDNSRLVRQADPRATGECLSTIAAVSALAIVLITTLTPSVAGLIAGYQIQSLTQEQQRLVNDGRGLEVEEARLLTTERLEHAARTHGMTPPQAGQVFHLQDASAGTVASNRGASAE